MSRLIGVFIFVVIVAGALLWTFVFSPRQNPDKGPEAVLKGYIGSEKANFLDDEEVKKILLGRYGLRLDYSRAGSLEMMDLDRAGVDFLWPSSRLPVEYFISKGGSAKKQAVVFVSPVVLYSWKDVVDVLGKAGFVTENAGIRSAALGPLLDLAVGQRSWADLGLPALLGKVTISSSDPVRSNSGYMFACLAAGLFAGDILEAEAVPTVLPKVRELFRRQGLMENSTGTLFERYLQLGLGSFPLVVGYENQIVEFSLANPKLWERVGAQLSLVYPEPTVHAEHIVLSLTEGGDRLVKALEDPEILALAWSKHGFRTGLENDPASLNLVGIPQTITKTVRLPRPEVAQTLMQGLNL